MTQGVLFFYIGSTKFGPGWALLLDLGLVAGLVNGRSNHNIDAPLRKFEDELMKQSN